MKKKLFILLLVFVMVFSFALAALANNGAKVDLDEQKLYLPEQVKDKTPAHTPHHNNPIDVAGA